MKRPRMMVPLAALAAVITIGPIVAGTALAADPTVVVRSGDTLTAIARRHGVKVSSIASANRIADPNRIYAGQRLTIPGATAPARGTAPVPAPATAAAAAPRVHVVARGENLTRIAKRYGVTVAAIVQANRIANPSRIYAGQRLTISGAAPAAVPPRPAAAPAPAPVAAPAAAPRVHVVARGENLTRIAKRYGVTVAAIVQANRIANPSRIYAGQRLTISRASTPAPAAAGRAAPSAPAMPPSMAALVAKRDAVRRVIVEEASRYRVPVALALAVAWHESGWQQKVESRAGAVGVMQLMPATAEWVGEAMLGTKVQIRDTRQNVRAGVRLLAHYLARYDGNRDLVLAAYYQGQTAADRHGVFPVSRSYIASIKLIERIFGG